MSDQVRSHADKLAQEEFGELHVKVFTVYILKACGQETATKHTKYCG